MVSKDKYDQYELLFDGAEVLNSMPTNLLQEIEDITSSLQSDPSYEKLFYKKNLIDCCFNSELLNAKDYLNHKKELKFDTFKVIESEFNKGNVTTGEYFLAKKLVNK